MKKMGWIILAVLAATQSACAAESQPRATAAAPTWTVFEDQFFRVEVPDWQEMEDPAPESVLALQQDGFFTLVNRYRNLPDLFADEFRNHVDRAEDTYLVRDEIQEGKPFFEFTTRDNGQTIRYQAVLHYCRGFTYAVIVGGRESFSITSLYKRVLDSAVCQDPLTVPDLDTGKIGMIANPARDDVENEFYPALRLAKENHVQVLHTYLMWGDIEQDPGNYFWEWQDYLMGYRAAEGFEVSVVVNVIHTAVRGSMPEDLENLDFDDPEMIDRFTNFVLAVLDRYPIQYLSIGNEVNDYFVNHRGEIDAYLTFFEAVSEAVKKEHPEVQIGMTFAYHDAESQNALDIVETMNTGDFLPFTLYLYNAGFTFNREPEELETYLTRMLDTAGETPIALVELGWNTSPSLQGSEQDQAEFVRQAFDMLGKYHSRIEFLSWFSLHDRDLENSYQSALTFIPHRPDLVDDPSFMGPFVDFLNYLGLREVDGTPKPAWEVFQEEADDYTAQRQSHEQ